MPAYDYAILFKKAGLLVYIVAAGITDPEPECCEPAAALFVFVSRLGCFIFLFNYAGVVSILCSQSVGLYAQWRALGITFATALVSEVLVFFEAAGVYNISIDDYNNAHNTTISHWPNFGGDGVSVITSSAPQPSSQEVVSAADVPAGTGTLVYKTWTATNFWMIVAVVAVGAIGLAPVAVGRWHPRQPRLAAAMYAMLLISVMVNYFSNWTSFSDTFSFDPLLLFSV